MAGDVQAAIIKRIIVQVATHLAIEEASWILNILQQTQEIAFRETVLMDIMEILIQIFVRNVIQSAKLVNYLQIIVLLVLMIATI